VFIFGSGVVGCASMKQPIVNLSSIEADYVFATTTACETMWMRRIDTKLLHEDQEPTHIFCDNKSSIALSRNHFFHNKTKYIDTKYHFI
jgi:hypothetical protein